MPHDDKSDSGKPDLLKQERKTDVAWKSASRNAWNVKMKAGYGKSGHQAAQHGGHRSFNGSQHSRH